MTSKVVITVWKAEIDEQCWAWATSPRGSLGGGLTAQQADLRNGHGPEARTRQTAPDRVVCVADAPVLANIGG